jgi:type IV secretion system protein VirB4
VSSKDELKAMDGLYARMGSGSFAQAWLSARGLHWAADLITPDILETEGDALCAAQ